MNYFCWWLFQNFYISTRRYHTSSQVYHVCWCKRRRNWPIETHRHALVYQRHKSARTKGPKYWPMCAAINSQMEATKRKFHVWHLWCGERTVSNSSKSSHTYNHGAMPCAHSESLSLLLSSAYIQCRGRCGSKKEGNALWRRRMDG